MSNSSAELDRHSIPVRERINAWVRVPGHWLLVGTLASMNVIMFPGVVRAILLVVAITVGVAVLILLGVTAHVMLPWWAGIAFIIGLVVYMLFQKLDAINANITRSNELKRRELGLRDW